MVFQLKLVDGGCKEAEFARSALFTKHPEMMGKAHMTWFSLSDLKTFNRKLDVCDRVILNDISVLYEFLQFPGL